MSDFLHLIRRQIANVFKGVSPNYRSKPKNSPTNSRHARVLGNLWGVAIGGTSLALAGVTSGGEQGRAAEKSAKGDEFTVVVYNVENLFDVDGVALFEDYQKDKYGPAHLLKKVENIAKVLKTVNDGRGPDVILFQELEADQTPSPQPWNAADFQRQTAKLKLEKALSEPLNKEVADWPAVAFLHKALAEAGLGDYEVALGEYRPDPTGRTVAHVNATFSRFPIVDQQTHQSSGARGILETTIKVDGQKVVTLNNHWKSGASDPEAEKIRVGNATTVRQRLDQILAADPSADVILGGDFNSAYNQATRHPSFGTIALNQVLGSQGDEMAIRESGGPQLYNLWYEIPLTERGSDVYRGEWGTLMQMLITRGLYDEAGVQYVDNSFGLLAIDGLNAQAGTLAPIRWNVIEGVPAGFSDHLPVQARFQRARGQGKNDFVKLKNPSSEDPQAESKPLKVDYKKVFQAKIPSIQQFRSDEKIKQADNVGHVFLINAKVSADRPFRIRIFEEDFTVWAFDVELRKEIYRRFAVGAPMKFYGELGLHEGKWQFIVQDAAWLTPR